MKVCKARTKTGRGCLNSVTDGEYCAVHGTLNSSGHPIWAGFGALVGNAVLPGPGGVLLGGIGGIVAKALLEEKSVIKKRVFVSFDFDNDRALKDFIIGQAKNGDSPFEIVDYSIREAAPEKDWQLKAAAAISRSELVLVMVGPSTHKAHGVLKEVQMAREAKVKIVQIIGYKDGNYTPVPGAGRLYAWNWENLKKLLS